MFSAAAAASRRRESTVFAARLQGELTRRASGLAGACINPATDTKRSGLSASSTLVGVQVQVFYYDAFFTCKKLAKKAPE